MAHVTGSVNTLAELVTAIFGACVANGWTLDTDVIHKGDVHVRVRVVGSTVEFLGGTGVDGSDQLTGAGPAVVRIRALAQALTFPMVYEVHILTNPDEVYVVVRYNVDFYQWAWWGKSRVLGLPGTGVWYTAPMTTNDGASPAVAVRPDGQYSGISISPSATCHSCTPFGPGFVSGGDFGGFQNGFVQHGLDGQAWNAHNVNPGGVETLYSLTQSLMRCLPNQWNQETVLLPITAWRSRGSNKVSLVVDAVHARWCRIDFHDPGDIVTIGSDQWKLYPFYRKNTVQRDVGYGLQHTGTFGFAIRYTGT